LAPLAPSSSASDSRWLVFHGAGGTALAAWTGLTIASRCLQAVPLAYFLAAMVSAWAATLAARQVSARLSHREFRKWVWVWAILFRLAAFPAVPILEDDSFRYLWDGRVFALTGDPCGKAPLDSFADPDLPAEAVAVLDQINHPDLPTVYGPLSEWGFRLAYAVAPYQLWPWKVLVVAADLVCLALLLARLPAPNAVLLAWCPLSIFETGSNAHPEALGVLFLLVACLLLERGRAACAGAALAAAVGVKATGAVLAPLLLLAGGWVAVAAFGGGLALLYVPFLPDAITGLAAFSGGWEFNGSLFSLLSAAGGHRAATVAAAVALLAVSAWVYRERTRPVDWTRWGGPVFGCLFLFSPVVNPWYLLWLAPFVAMYPAGSAASQAGMAALGAVSLSYVCGIHLGWPELGAYDPPAWLRPLEYGILAIVCISTSRVWQLHRKD
jgi:hypothetical protein